MSETDPLSEMEESANSGVIMEMLPRTVNGNVAIGLSVAINALADDKEEVALPALKTVVDKLEEDD